MGKNALIMSETRGDVGIVRFTTSQVLDELNVQQLGQELNDLVEKSYMVKMVINFDRIKFLSSAVLGKLISLHKRLQKEKGRLAFCCINKDVMQVFKITRLDKLIPIFEGEDEAVGVVNNPSLFDKGEMFK
jgi:anti-sigma B factor antagonist